MSERGQRRLIGKILIKGKIVLKTGLHIGGSQESMQIGGVDLPVIRDSGNNLPYIPGSSLKGKLRSTVEKFGYRVKNGKNERLTSNRNIGGAYRNQVFVHCCEDVKYALNCDVCRVFGSSGDDKVMPRDQKAENWPALLTVRDAQLDETLLGATPYFTEVKIETGIDRTSMSANPRRVERVLPENRFDFEMIYSVESIALGGQSSLSFNDASVKKDLNNLLTSMELIQNEGLGGYTSRGYGKIEFRLTDFLARSLPYFQGTTTKQQGKTGEEFFASDARVEIDNLVDFLKGEAKDVISG
jgi:CRISPR-associated protein Csm3